MVIHEISGRVPQPRIRSFLFEKSTMLNALRQEQFWYFWYCIKLYQINLIPSVLFERLVICKTCSGYQIDDVLSALAWSHGLPMISHVSPIHIVHTVHIVHIVHPQGISGHIKAPCPLRDLARIPQLGPHTVDSWPSKAGSFFMFFLILEEKTVLRNPQCPCCNLSVFQFFLEPGTALKPKDVTLTSSGYNIYAFQAGVSPRWRRACRSVQTSRNGRHKKMGWFPWHFTRSSTLNN